MEKETGREKIKGVTACTACQRIARRCSASRGDGGNGRREVVGVEVVVDGGCGSEGVVAVGGGGVG